MRRILFLAGIFLLSCAPKEQIGEPYPGWRSGELDIHFIYTGRGESVFHIFPDATTMLVDAGDYEATVPMTDPKPDLSRKAGEWITRYIERVNPSGHEVDYLMISHFHDDHTGDVSIDAPTTQGRAEDYKLIGVAEVGEKIRFKNFIDRGYPNYNYPVQISDPHTDNYLKFARYQKQKYGAKQEQFKVGALNQIALLNKPLQYSRLFSIRNLAANGEVWSGEEGKTTRYYDLNPANAANRGNENTKSIAFRIDYGPFSYFAGGDITHSLKNAEGESINIEAKAGEACGEVDVCKCNHHAYKDSMHPDFLSSIKAKAYINPVWDQYHTQPAIIERILSQEIYQGDRMFYTQYIVEKARKEHADKEWYKGVCPHNGHIVVKAYDKGRKFKIYRLSADDEQMTIQAIYGPFDSRK